MIDSGSKRSISTTGDCFEDIKLPPSYVQLFILFVPTYLDWFGLPPRLAKLAHSHLTDLSHSSAHEGQASTSATLVQMTHRASTHGLELLPPLHESKVGVRVPIMFLQSQKGCAPHMPVAS